MNLADYRITYNVAGWERIAQTSGELCAPVGAVRAVNALCDEVERNRAAIAELVGALKDALEVGSHLMSAKTHAAAHTAIAKHDTSAATPKGAVDLHMQGIYAVLDAEGVPVTGTMAASGYSARAQFVREMNMFWSKAVEQGYRVVALAAIRGNIDT